MNVTVLCESNHHHVCSQVYDVQNNLEHSVSANHQTVHSADHWKI